MDTNTPSPMSFSQPKLGLVRRVAALKRRSFHGFSTASDHDLVQRRIGTSHGLSALFLLGFLLAATLQVAILAPTQALTLDLARPAYCAAIGVLLPSRRICQGRRLSWRALAALDAATLLMSMTLLCIATATAPKGVQVEHLAESILALSVALRAALVPARPLWTILVSAVGALPLPVATYLTALAAPPVHGPFPASMGVVRVLAWSVAATIASGAIARVVYGLRVDVKSAMHLGQYTLEEKIGEGGMGSVYRARHAMLHRPTALKLLTASRADTASTKRFEREVQMTSRLTHPNTITVFDYRHTQDGVFYYAMELLDGLSLEQLCEQTGPLPEERAVHILSQVARALSEAHSVGLIHRDIKPANIFLSVRGGIHDFVKVLDFGLVRALGAVDESATEINALAGAPLYMAPEAVSRPHDIDARVDIYALGVVAYYLLTGQTPFRGDNPVAIFHGHMFEKPRRPSESARRVIPHAVEELILRCLAKDPSHRPGSARELADELDALGREYPWNESEAKAWWQARNSAPRLASRPDLADASGPTVKANVSCAVRARFPEERAQARACAG